MTAYWFKPKRYGYGATPVTWQGWSVTVVTMVIVIATTMLLAAQTALDPWFWAAVATDIVAVAALWTISRRKTDGEWRWRWGDR